MLTRASQSLPGGTLRNPATPQLPWFSARVYAFGKKRMPAGSPTAPNGSLAVVPGAPLEAVEDGSVTDVDGAATDGVATEVFGAATDGAVTGAGGFGLSGFARSVSRCFSSGATQSLTHTASTPTLGSTGAAAGASFAATTSFVAASAASSSVRSISIPRPAHTSAGGVSGRSPPDERTFTRTPTAPWSPSEMANAMATG